MYFAQFADDIDDIELVLEDHSTYSWVAASELEAVYLEGREANDPEFIVMQKGFALLRGEQPEF